MNRELEIAVLMEDNCTRRDAEKHLKNGTTVYDEPLEYTDMLKDCGFWDEFECTNVQEYFEKVRKGEIEDISMVEYKNREYLIAYVL